MTSRVASPGSTLQLEARSGEEMGAKGCTLRVVDGPDVGKVFPLTTGELVVGSGEEADFRLSDAAVSSRHCRIAVSDAGLQAEDLGSTNGTWYLGSRIGRATLGVGAVLKVGRSRIALSSLEQGGGAQASARTSYGRLLGESLEMRRLFALLERLEAVDYSVLLIGETGVGKEVIGREIHEHSKRATGPWEIFDCGAVAPNLIESELFGHTKGAFTGAVAERRGVFARANGGTILLDEIGELPLELQPKLLRVLESREVRPVGGNAALPVDVRVIAATHRDLVAAVRNKTFREDLYFRLNVVTLPIPPLRSRREDIPALVQHFVAAAAGDVAISADTLELFTCGYDWPGNVRELRNAVARVLALGTVPDALRPSEGGAEAGSDAPGGAGESYLQAKKRVLDAFERDYLVTQLQRAGNNIAQAARLAGMDRSYFKRILRRHGLLARTPDDDA